MSEASSKQIKAYTPPENSEIPRKAAEVLLKHPDLRLQGIATEMKRQGEPVLQENDVNEYNRKPFAEIGVEETSKEGQEIAAINAARNQVLAAEAISNETADMIKAVFEKLAKKEPLSSEELNFIDGDKAHQERQLEIRKEMVGSVEEEVKEKCGKMGLRQPTKLDYARAQKEAERNAADFTLDTPAQEALQIALRWHTDNSDSIIESIVQRGRGSVKEEEAIRRHDETAGVVVQLLEVIADVRKDLEMKRQSQQSRNDTAKGRAG